MMIRLSLKSGLVPVSYLSVCTCSESCQTKNTPLVVLEVSDALGEPPYSLASPSIPASVVFLPTP